MKQDEKLTPLGGQEPAGSPAPSHAPWQTDAVPAMGSARPARSSRKKWLLGLALVFFLFSIIFIVPVRYVPGLRNLAWMMGLSGEASGSFGTALLGWIGNGGKPLSSAAGDGAALSVFDKQSGQGFQAGGPQSGLFNLAAVNASLRARGQTADGLSGVYNGLENENDRAAYYGRVNGWSQDAQQDATKKAAQEVYFGTDAELAARAAAEDKATKGSADTAGKFKSSGIIGAVASDWFANAIANAARLSQGEMDRGIERATGLSTPLTQFNGALSGGEKAERDLAQVWLLSKAANKAQQAMLKKQLAEAGYIGMEMPKKVYDSLGEGSGLMLDGSEIMSDFQETNKFLLDEESCRKVAQGANANVKELVEDSQELINQVVVSVPGGSCDEAAMAAWKTNVESISTKCQATKEIYSNLESSCDGRSRKSEGTCNVTILTTYVVTLASQCDAWKEAIKAYELAQAAYEAAQKAYEEAQAKYEAAKAAEDQAAADLAAAKAAENPDPNTIARLEKELKEKTDERKKAEDDRDKKEKDRDEKLDDKNKKEQDRDNKEKAKDNTANDFNDNKDDNMKNTFDQEGDGQFFPQEDQMQW